MIVMDEKTLLMISALVLLMLAALFLTLYLIKVQKFGKLEKKTCELQTLFSEKEKNLDLIEKRLNAAVSDNLLLTAENTRLKSDMKNQNDYLNQKIADLEKNKEALALQFKDISTEVIQAQNQRFNKEQKDTFELLIKPFQEQMSEFKKKIETAHDDNVRFDAQLENLFNLNRSLSKDAQDLSQALKGNKKIQGNWGEFQLERILEISGLQKGVNYVTQETFKTEENQLLRPDVVIKLPNERQVIIDSKVSLNDYMSYVNAEDEHTREDALKKHIQCLRKHVDELSAKEYQKLLKDQSLDYVVIFVPVESAYVEAVRADSSLYDYAYKKNIAITTPSSLLPILRTIENLWQIEKRNKNVLEIAQIGGSLYDKIANFIDDMLRIEKSIDTARKNYEQAMNKLSTGKGNALSLAERLKDKGAKATKVLALESHDVEILQIQNEVVND